jgi:hypothetical protein
VQEEGREGGRLQMPSMYSHRVLNSPPTAYKTPQTTPQTPNLPAPPLQQVLCRRTAPPPLLAVWNIALLHFHAQEPNNLSVSNHNHNAGMIRCALSGTGVQSSCNAVVWRRIRRLPHRTLAISEFAAESSSSLSSYTSQLARGCSAE